MLFDVGLAWAVSSDMLLCLSLMLRIYSSMQALWLAVAGSCSYIVAVPSMTVLCIASASPGRSKISAAVYIYPEQEFCLCGFLEGTLSLAPSAGRAP